MVKDIVKMIKEGKYIEVRNEITKMNVVDIALFLEELNNEHLLIIFRMLPKDIAANVFSYMSYEQQKYIIESFTDKEIKTIIGKLFLDDTIDFLEEMPANVVKKILKNTDEQRRKLINQFLNYPENSAGSIMTIEYVELKKEMTIKHALRHIKKTGIDKETIDTCYVIDDSSRKLEGIVPIRKLILNDENMIIKDIMDTNIKYVYTIDDQEKVAALFKKYDLISMPVVDKENRLVGIITIDDIVDVIEQENTEDFQKMAAMQPSEKRYLETNVTFLAKQRITRLLILMISATFTANIIRRFEDVLQSVVILAAFIPMLMDTGGNAGSQSSTLIIRGLALGEIKLKDVFKVLYKELQVSCVVGSVLAVLNFIKIYYVEKVGFKVSAIVCLSLFCTIVLAKIVGGVLPIIAKKLKMDPAIMAGPLITTIVDAVALIIYFAMASRFLLLI